MKRFLASFSFALLSAAFALSQSSGSFARNSTGFHGTMHFSAASRFSGVAAIAGAPFSAEEVDEDAQTLADGTHIRHINSDMKIYRDSMGRTRTEREFPGPMEGRANMRQRPAIIEIYDPVAHVRYVFDLEDAVAHRQELPADRARPGSVQPHTGHAVIVGGPASTIASAAADSSQAAITTVHAFAPSAVARHKIDEESHPQSPTEDIGTQIIEGIPAEGKRHTITWPVGSMGNDRPIVEITEYWTSPDLKEVILRKSEDPRYGERTHKLVNIDRSEPDSSLFEPPPGYTVKNEEGDFTIEWSAPR
jgi:uncharacterized protein YdeI (BOF family)